MSLSSSATTQSKDSTPDPTGAGIDDSGWSPRVIEAALDAVITIDATGCIVQFNAAAERMFGYACGGDWRVARAGC